MLITISKLLKSRQLPINAVLETVMVEIESRTILTCIYVQPNCTEEYFAQLLFCIRSLPDDQDLLVVGDFNLPDIDWKTLSGVGTHGRDFCDCVFDKNLTQVLLEPTHKLGGTLDLLLSNCPDRIGSLWVDPTSPSDHYLITFKLQLRNCVTCRQKEHIQVPCYGKADLVGLDQFLLDVDFSPL